MISVTILILIDGFLQCVFEVRELTHKGVTILILIDGFLQFDFEMWFDNSYASHNPYFNRWFSAIGSIKNHLNGRKSHNPYFNRWFSAIS